MISKRHDDPELRRFPIVQLIYQFRFLWWIAIAVLIALGFDFKTPAQHFKDMESEYAQAYSKLDGRMTNVEHQHDQIERYLGALSIAMCIDRPRRETRLMELPCDSLLRVKH